MLYRTVKTDIWGDPWFVDLSPESKILFIYLFTNRNVSACGAMQLSISQIVFETKVSAKKVEKLLIEFGDKVLWLPEHNLIVVRNFYKHQRSQSSDNYTKAAKKAMIGLPEMAKAWLYEVYPELNDTHPQPITNPSPTLGDKEEATVRALATAKAEVSTPHKSPKGDSPPGFKPWDLFAAMCEEAGHQPEEITGKVRDRQLQAAKQLIQSGATPDDIVREMRWLSGQSWVTSGVDMALLYGQWAKWTLAGKPEFSQGNGRASPIGNGRTPRIQSRYEEDIGRMAAQLDPIWGSAQGGADRQ